METADLTFTTYPKIHCQTVKSYVKSCVIFKACWKFISTHVCRNNWRYCSTVTPTIMAEGSENQLTVIQEKAVRK